MKKTIYVMLAMLLLAVSFAVAEEEVERGVYAEFCIYNEEITDAEWEKAEKLEEELDEVYDKYDETGDRSLEKKMIELEEELDEIYGSVCVEKELTEEEQEKINPVLEDYKKKFAEKKEEVRAIEDDLMDIWDDMYDLDEKYERASDEEMEKLDEEYDKLDEKEVALENKLNVLLEKIGVSDVFKSLGKIFG